MVRADRHVRTDGGREVLTYDCVDAMRREDSGRNNPLRFIAQAGAQERLLSQDADILIGGGSRGGSKTFSLVMEALKDIEEPDFNALIVRNEKADLEQVVKYSLQMYSQFGSYNRSINDMTWNFDRGGHLNLSYYSDPMDSFRKRFQGKQYSYIGIDEITHMPYEKFKYLVTCNRNGAHLRNRIWGTCNPDPDSWVRRFIDWWIGPDGFPVPSRDGVVRYCFMDGDTPDTIYWGSTPHEVYLQCMDVVDGLWRDAYAALGYDRERMFVKSVTFVRAGLEENVKLLESDPNYVANLAQQGEEQRARDLDGNWNYRSAGEDLIKMEDMEAFFSAPQGDGRRYASCDVAFTGGDSLVMFLWRGWHVADVFVCRSDARSSLAAVKARLEEWGVPEEDFVYDLNGLGQTFKGFFPHALPFNNEAAVEPRLKGVYYNLKSQCAYILWHKFADREISIDRGLLSRRFSGRGFKGAELSSILMRERKAIRRDPALSDRGFALIRKERMKEIVGHSPDYIEAMLMRAAFDVARRGGPRPRPASLPRYVAPRSAWGAAWPPR